MATLTVNTPAFGTAVVTSPVAAAAGGDTLAATLAAGNSGVNVLLDVINASGSSVTVTLAGIQSCSQGATHNVVTTCTANATTSILVPPQCIATNGNITVTYSAVTSVTVQPLYQF